MDAKCDQSSEQPALHWRPVDAPKHTERVRAATRKERGELHVGERESARCSPLLVVVGAANS